MIQKAIEAIKQDDCSVAAITKNGELLADCGASVRPLFRLYKAHTAALAGAVVADRIIGKAAASLLAAAHVTEAHGFLMSESGLKMLQNYGIKASYGELVVRIDNRTGTDMCPMEKTVLELEDPAQCAAAIEEFIATVQYPG